MAKWSKHQIAAARTIRNLERLHADAAFCGMTLDMPTTADIKEWDKQQARARREQPEGVERRYTIPELAAEWGLSENKIIALFENEPGVIRAVGPKRTRRWIPESVALRVNKRLGGNALQSARSTGGPLRVVHLSDRNASVVKKVRDVVNRHAFKQVPNSK